MIKRAVEITFRPYELDVSSDVQLRATDRFQLSIDKKALSQTKGSLQERILRLRPSTCRWIKCGGCDKT